MTYFKIYHKGGKFDGNNIKVVDTEEEARAFIIEYRAKYAEQLKEDGATLYYTDKYNNVINWTPEEEEEEETAEEYSPLEAHVNYYVDFINGATFDPYDTEDGLEEYDIKYTVDAYGEYISARVMLAGGGPNIYLDTADGKIIGYWGVNDYSAYLSESASELVNEYYRDMFNSTINYNRGNY